MCASQSTSLSSRDSMCSHPLKMPSLAATGKEIFPSWQQQGCACSGANAHTLLFLQEEGNGAQEPGWELEQPPSHRDAEHSRVGCDRARHTELAFTA